MFIINTIKDNDFLYPDFNLSILQFLKPFFGLNVRCEEEAKVSK